MHVIALLPVSCFINNTCRSEENTTIMSFQHWRPKHAVVLRQMEVLLSRILFIRRTIGAKMIQKAAR
jgi:hypothetical protein